MLQLGKEILNKMLKKSKNPDKMPGFELFRAKI